MVENTFRERCGSPFGGVLVVLDFRAELDESFSFESGIVGVHANLIRFEFFQCSWA